MDTYESLYTQYRLIRDKDRAETVIDDTFIEMDKEELSDKELSELLVKFIRAKYSAHVTACKNLECRPEKFNTYCDDMRFWTFSKLRNCERIEKIYVDCVKAITKEAKSEYNPRKRTVKTDKTNKVSKVDNDTKAVKKNTKVKSNTAKETPITDNGTNAVEIIRNVSTKLMESTHTKQSKEDLIKQHEAREAELMSDAEYARIYAECKAMGFVK